MNYFFQFQTIAEEAPPPFFWGGQGKDWGWGRSRYIIPVAPGYINTLSFERALGVHQHCKHVRVYILQN